jgi:hypothetical protein
MTDCPSRFQADRNPTALRAWLNDGSNGHRKWIHTYYMRPNRTICTSRQEGSISEEVLQPMTNVIASDDICHCVD